MFAESAAADSALAVRGLGRENGVRVRSVRPLTQHAVTRHCKKASGSIFRHGLLEMRSEPSHGDD